MPPGPGVAVEHSDPVDPLEPAKPSGALVPPLPPPEFQQVGEPTPVAPPLPGEEHRLDLESDGHPSSPPLPPDSMRTGG